MGGNLRVILVRVCWGRMGGNLRVILVRVCWPVF